jgi:hypothetical protein
MLSPPDEVNQTMPESRLVCMGSFQSSSEDSGTAFASHNRQEASMHTHGSQINLNAGNPFSAAAENAIAAHRATNLRKRGIKKTATTALVASPEEALMISRWMDGGRSLVQSKGESAAGA